MNGEAGIVLPQPAATFRSTVEVSKLVTTIIPVHNRAMMLREAVASVLAQTYRPIEIIIVDDGSTDSTSQTAETLSREHPGEVRVFWQANAGPGAARNLGLQHAHGEFIQYLDSDDLLEPRKFEWQVEALRENPETGLAYGISTRIDLATGASRVWARTAEAISGIFPSFLVARGWDTNAPLWHRSTCDAVGPWLELRCLEDWEHDLRAGMLGFRAVHVPKPGAVVRDHKAMRASGMSTGFTVEIVRDMARAHAAVWTRMRALDLRDWRYLEEFSRKVFWIARLCGERGLTNEADEALEIASEMMTGHGAVKRLRLFRALVRLLGWRLAVAVGERAMRKLAA